MPYISCRISRWKRFIHIARVRNFSAERFMDRKWNASLSESAIIVSAHLACKIFYFLACGFSRKLFKLATNIFTTVINVQWSKGSLDICLALRTVTIAFNYRLKVVCSALNSWLCSLARGFPFFIPHFTFQVNQLQTDSSVEKSIMSVKFRSLCIIFTVICFFVSSNDL